MKRLAVNLCGVTFGAAALLLMGAAPACAQDELVMRVTVPFEFHVGEVTAPAGRYLIRTLDGQSDLMSLDTAAGQHLAIFTTNKAGRPDDDRTPVVLFAKAGAETFSLSGLVEDGGVERDVMSPKPLRGEDVHTLRLPAQ